MMVIIKLNADTEDERDVEIVNEEGTWKSGNYHIFANNEVKRDQLTEPHDTNSTDFLGGIDVDKENDTWKYHGKKLVHEEQKQVAEFIIDYIAPDDGY